VGRLPITTTLLPTASHLPGDERYARSDQVKMTNSSHRMLGAGKDHSPAYAPTQVKGMICVSLRRFLIGKNRDLRDLSR
jgi:hypothetical protein